METKYCCSHHLRQKTVWEALQQLVAAAITLLVHTRTLKHTQPQPQMIFFSRDLKDEAMAQSRKLSIAAISGSSVRREISV